LSGRTGKGKSSSYGHSDYEPGAPPSPAQPGSPGATGHTGDSGDGGWFDVRQVS
jgi:hypothetical protein